MKRITVHGTGSAIADSLYTGVSIQSPEFQRYCSKVSGDGGLEVGKLVLTEDFEAFTGKPADQVVAEIAGKKTPDSLNLGGPGPVALINAAQLTPLEFTKVRFFSTNGNDEAGRRLQSILDQTPVDLTYFRTVERPAPITFVLSDPTYNNGAGERTFINGIRSAWELKPEDLVEDFYAADIVVFGGTALVPNIHNDLDTLTAAAKQRGCFTVVTTVYDFPNEKKRPGQPWPLGRSDKTYSNLDLLITDLEEAFRLSGSAHIEVAAKTLIDKGVRALVVTNGTKEVYCFADGTSFQKTDKYLPVSHAIEDARTAGPVHGDTTGAGDNFAGGIVASLIMQRQNEADGLLSLPEACAWGIASGDFACFYPGGTYLETTPGEKYAKVSAIVDTYIGENRSVVYGD